MNNQDDIIFGDIHRKSTRVGGSIPSAGPLIPEIEAYSIKREIGRGGMAVVYEAIEKSLNRVVALKVLSRELSQDTDLIRRFVNEAQAAARLSHPNIVQIYSIGQEKGVYYFAMEYIRGKSVESMLNEKKKIPLMECIDIIKQTILALQEAYKNNIVHRDIKPGNLLVTEQAVVKVADFGLAAEIKDAILSTVRGKIIGTPLYISPEQAQGKEGDCRSDIYSLGITIYQMLSGQLPFVSSDTKILMKYHIEKPLPQLPPEIPLSVRKLVYRMTEKNPEKRFSNYESLLKELDRSARTLTSNKYVLPVLSLGLLFAVGVATYSFFYRPAIKDTMQLVEIEKDKRIEAIYNNVIENVKKNPENYSYNIKELFRLIKEYPGTEWAYRAEQKVDMIIFSATKEGAKELKEITSVCDKLVGETRYKEAIDKYESIKNIYKDMALETLALENIDYIMDEAKKDFQSRNDKAIEYINQYKFEAAKKLYEEVITSFGLKDFTSDAKDKLRVIGEKEADYKMESDAKNIFTPIEKKVAELVSENKYDEALKLLENLDKINENPVLFDLVNNEMAKVKELSIKYESTMNKEKIMNQLSVYNKVNEKVNSCIANYKYSEAVDIIKEGLANIELLELKQKLEALKEKLQYLVSVKNDIITGINNELLNKKITNISADNDTLIFVVSGGYVGVPWKETKAGKIYELAQAYTGNTAFVHMALGVFCLTYGLKDEAGKEFTIALRMESNLQGIIEKYFIQIAEAEVK